MFGYVAANPEELTQEQRERYVLQFAGVIAIHKIWKIAVHNIL